MTLLVCFRRVCPIHVRFFVVISPGAVLVWPFGFQDVSQTCVNEYL